MRSEVNLLEHLPVSRPSVDEGATMPRVSSPDSTLALLNEGYAFISNRCDFFGSDIFECRLLLQRTICMRGAEAARLFYDEDKFQRAGAPPRLLKKSLLGRGSVQGLDGEAHRHRKQMFMTLMSPSEIARLVQGVTQRWRDDSQAWQEMNEVVLHDAVQTVLCRAVCAWTGVPLSAAEASRRTRDLAQLIDGAGGVAPRHFKARFARKRTERWIADLVDRVRVGMLEVEPSRPLRVIAEHRDLAGRLLTSHDAAVEVINLLRPTVAIAWFVSFAALALHEHPHARASLQMGDDEAIERFVHEVRRFYAFFPAATARVREDFEWNGYRFAKGTRVLLDLYGTNRHRAIWTDPDAFDPERFRGRALAAFDFIPQGGGDHFAGHRCAGEWVTIAVLKEAVRLLTQEMRYDVPDQDLRVDWSRMPTIPKSRFVITNVQRSPTREP